MKKLLRLLVCCMAVSLATAMVTPMQVQAASNIRINKTKAVVYAGNAFTLSLSGATSSKVKWSSSDGRIATVSSKGVVRAKATGKAVITAKYGKKAYTCNVTVKTPFLNKTSATLYIGKSFTLNLTGATIKKIKSSNTKIVVVNNSGKVAAVKPGTATVFVTDTLNRTYRCTVISKCKHTYTAKVTRKATCAAEGIKTYTCKCGSTYTEKIAKLKHTFDKGKVVKPTCTAEGYTLYTCTVCKSSSKTKVTTKLNHSYGQWTETLAATETTEGLKERECSVCKYKEEEVIPVIPHECSYEVVSSIEPTCTADGSITKKCSICSETNTESIPATGHSATDWIIDSNATCTENGSKHTECTICNAVISSDTISATGHAAGGWEENPASCESDGSRVQRCSTCSATLNTEVIPATGHNYGDWSEDFPATEEAAGQESRSCACGASMSRAIAQLEHTHNYQLSNHSDAGCTTSGYDTYSCSCGDSYSDTIAPTGHNAGDWEETPATCTTDGSKVKKCTTCGTTLNTEVIPASGHNYSSETTSATCTTNGSVKYTCSCGDTYSVTITATGHSFGEWQVTKEATSNVEGIKTRTCTECSAVETDTIECGGIETTYEVEVLDGSNTEVIGHFDTEAAQTFLALLNADRVEMGLPALTYKSTMQNTCNKRGYQTAVSWDHVVPWSTSDTGSNVYGYAAEVLCCGTSDPQLAYEALMNHQAHRDIMLTDFSQNLGKNYTAVSLFCKKTDAGYEYYWVQTFK